MRKREDILERSKEAIRKQTKAKLIEKMRSISALPSGETLYLRPFKSDDQMIDEIAEVLGEKKSAVAQKLLHLVLHNSPNDAERDKRQIELLHWLINNEKDKSVQEELYIARLERLDAHAREMEKALNRIEESSRFFKILLSEIYCSINVCVSSLNQIFTKIIEYFSPVEIERKNSSDFANHSLLVFVDHSLGDLVRFTDHHDLDRDSIETEMLYLYSKIDNLKTRLAKNKNAQGSVPE